MPAGIVNSLTGETPPLAAIKLKDNTTPAYYLILDSDSDGTVLTADRTLIFDVNNASRTIDLAGDLTLDGSNSVAAWTVSTGGTLTVGTTVWTSGTTDNINADSIENGSTNAIPTLTQETNWGTAYTHSQIAGGNSVHVSTTENTNWDTAYTHSQDNTQAHSDYLLNSGDDTMGGSLTCTGVLASGAALKLQDDAAQDIHLFASATSGENQEERVYGYVTAGTAARYGYLQMSDTNDEFIIGLEDNANSEGVTIELPEANQEFRIRDDGVQKFSVGQSDTDLAGAAIDMGGVVIDVINESLADGGKFDLPGSASGGFGFVVGGDDASYAYFTYTSDGVPTLVSHNNCNTTEDNNTTLNIFDSGTVVGINNELGGTYVVQGFIVYTPD